MTTTSDQTNGTSTIDPRLEQRRLDYLGKHIVPGARRFFEQNEWARSIGLLVAQYWNDEASDAVHCQIFVSQLEVPDLEASFAANERGDDPEFVDANVPAGVEIPWRATYEIISAWDDNGTAISLFAAYCCEGGNQEAAMRDNYRPYAILRPGADGSVDIDVVGVQIRPWLDGVSPEWDEDE